MFNWTVSAWPILASAALKSTLVLGAAWLITYLLRGRSAAARHTVWTAAAAALVALPLLTVALPALRVRIANAVLPADPGIVFSATASTPAGAESAATSGTGARQSNGCDARAGAQHRRQGCPDAAVDGGDRRRIPTDAGGLCDALANPPRGASFARSGGGGYAGVQVWESSIRSRCWRRLRGCP